MAANNQVPSKQLIMYPKHLVYPDGVDAKRDVCLEELRASRTRYCPSPSPDCDMDMTEAYCGNITVNVPVVASMEKGREVLHLMEHKPEKLLVLSKEEPGGNMTRELQEKENLPVSLNQFDFTPSASESYSHQYSYNGASFSMKGALSFSESDSLVSSACQSEEEAKMFKEKTVLKQERHSDQVHQSLQYTHSSESLYANNKLPCAVSQEGRLDSFSVYNDSQVSINQPAAGQSTRPPLQVLPQEKSLTSFSVYEEASINQPSFKQSVPSARPPLQVLPQDKSLTSFSVYEEASINQPSFKQSAPSARPPLQVLPQDKSLTSFSVYEEASINQPSFKQSAPSARPPLQVLPQDKSLTSFSVYEEASINQPSFKQSAPSARPPLQVLPQDKSLTSFSVYEEASINQPSFKQSAPSARPPLQVLPQDKSLTSFSVYEEASINQPSFKQSAPSARPPLQVLPQDKSLTSFSVYEETSINQPSFKQSAPARPPLQVLPQDKSMGSFSVYEEASINQPSFKQSAPPAKPPLQVLPQDKSLTSFSVYEEASINQPSFKQSAPPARPPLQVLPQDKSVYDEASISHPSQPQTASSNTMPMKVLNCAPSLSSVPLTTSDASSHCLASIEKLSLSQKAPVTISTSLHSHNFPVPSSITNQEQPLPNITNPVSSTHSLPVPFSINNPLPPPLDALPVPQSVTTPPTNEQEAESISPESGTHSHPLVNETIDPSFFIPGYLSDDPTSTPCGGRRVGLAPFDVTAIQSYSPQSSNTKPLPPPPPLPVPSLPPPPPPPPPSQPLPQTDPAPPIMQPYSFRGQHLDPIQEESRSYCSSSSGSTTTCSSKNLSTHSNASRSANISQQSQHNEDEEPPEVQDLRSLGVMNLKRQVNPFTPETIQFMLQSLPITVTPVHRLPKSSPSMTTGHTVTLADGSSCSVIGKLAKGGFASVYNVKMMNGSTKALKIQNPPCLWEVAIIEELHKRLKANDLLKFSQCFMSVDAVHLYTNSSIIAYNYYPHGTLLDLVNTCRTTSKKLTEAVLLYYTTEICQLVEALHCCGIIHADIKPDNIMLRDIRPITDYTSIRGRGVCLLDFGRAIDAQSFPRGTQFVGSCGTDSFQCIQMLNNEPWSWHTDLHCIAGTVHVLLHLDYMEVIKNAMTGEYVPSKSLPRNYDRVLWMKFFTDLLNWSGEGQPDMKALTQPLSRKLSLNVSHLKLNLNYMWTQMERQRGFPK
ncbi:PREDICTED: formin-like protein 20 isoform X2 [Amphimedon queenslandica]|uniref:Protein kinase domain-containing protein n=1 Tax=Amphimedon queenslandica TaxID=400682 RepID=A0AAN0J192_AMPQE|nr:PREDICTED: formin-like protein 20 isoform X2 [Amphimedon queenslandica]|eukprot:XP_019850512.1 PREDICTED: formin-like protein 20 isoform X2 [Amphimedon queenslandica]